MHPPARTVASEVIHSQTFQLFFRAFFQRPIRRNPEMMSSPKPNSLPSGKGTNKSGKPAVPILSNFATFSKRDKTDWLLGTRGCGSRWFYGSVDFKNGAQIWRNSWTSEIWLRIKFRSWYIPSQKILDWEGENFSPNLNIPNHFPPDSHQFLQPPEDPINFLKKSTKNFWNLPNIHPKIHQKSQPLPGHSIHILPHRAFVRMKHGTSRSCGVGKQLGWTGGNKIFWDMKIKWLEK